MGFNKDSFEWKFLEQEHISLNVYCIFQLLKRLVLYFIKYLGKYDKNEMIESQIPIVKLILL